MEQDSEDVGGDAKMKYILNVQKGSTINHPSVGRIEGGKAYKVSDEAANQVKNIINVVVFEEVIDNGGDNS